MALLRPAGELSRGARIALAGALSLSAGCGRIGYELQHERAAASRTSVDTKDSSVDASQGGAPGAGGSISVGTGGAPAQSGGSGGTAPDASVAGAGGRITDAGSRAPDAGPDSATCRTPVSGVSDYCVELPSLPDPPVIDGLLECGVLLKPVTPIGWTGGVTPPDATAEYAVAWRADGVYFFVRVHDATLVPAGPSQRTWEGDAVELFVDDDGTYRSPPAYDVPGSRQLIVAAPENAITPETRGELWAFGNNGSFEKWGSNEFGAYPVSDGYVVEAFVRAPDLNLPSIALAAGAHIGMDLSIDVSYPSPQSPDAAEPGNRLGQYFLQVGETDAGTLLPPFDVRAFCRPVLVP